MVQLQLFNESNIWRVATKGFLRHSEEEKVVSKKVENFHSIKLSHLVVPEKQDKTLNRKQQIKDQPIFKLI